MAGRQLLASWPGCSAAALVLGPYAQGLRGCLHSRQRSQGSSLSPPGTLPPAALALSAEKMVRSAAPSSSTSPWATLRPPARHDRMRQQASFLQGEGGGGGSGAQVGKTALPSLHQHSPP
jgi:hypothetical protein